MSGQGRKAAGRRLRSNGRERPLAAAELGAANVSNVSNAARAVIG